MDLVFVEVEKIFVVVTEVRSVQTIPDVMHEPRDRMKWLVLILFDELLVVAH